MQKVGYTVVDIRPPFDFKRGHPAGARNVPFYFYTEAGGIRENTEEFVSLMKSLFPLDAKLIVVDKLGTRSPDAVVALLQAGFMDVRDLEGGYKGMESVGMPATMTDDASYAQALADVKAALAAKKK